MGAQRFAVGGEGLRRIFSLDVLVAEAFVHLRAFVAVGRLLGDSTQVGGRLLIFATFERQVGQRAQGGQVAAAKSEGRLVKLEGPFRVAQLDLRLCGVPQSLGDLVRVQGGVRVIGQAAEV